MKKITPPEIDDKQELYYLSENRRLGSYPLLRDYRDQITNAYDEYLDQKANPWVLKRSSLPRELQDYLRSHYRSEIKDSLLFLTEYRKKLSPDLCLMCGGFGHGTLDHYLPKECYADFSLFSKNLVPACLCNTKRGTTIKGETDGERIIHPYFDDFLGARLYQSKFEGTFETPKITYQVIDKDHREYDVCLLYTSDAADEG